MRVRTVLKGLGIAVVAAVVAVAAILMSVDVNQYRGVIEEQAEAATGRDLSIGGPIELSISLSPAVVLQDVAFANAPWGSRPEMVTARRLEAQVELLPLLSGEIKVRRLVLVGPDVLLEVNEDGVGNWALDLPASDGAAETAADEAATAGRQALPDLQLVRVEDAVVVYNDRSTGEKRSLSLAALEAAAQGWNAPLAVQGSGRLDDLSFSLAGTLGPLSDLMNTATVYPVVMKVEAAGATVNVDGSIEAPEEARGIDLGVAVSVPEPAATARAFNAAAPADLPALRIDGRLSDTQEGGWSVRNLAASLGDTSLAGALTVTLDGPRPKVTGTLSSPLIDLAALLPSEGGEGDAAGAGQSADMPSRLFADTPLPLAGLKAADANVELAVSRLVLPDGMALADVTGKVSLSNGRLMVAPASARAGGGTVRAEVTLDASSEAAPAVALTLRTEDVMLGRVLAEVGQGDLIQEGPADVRLDLTGRGGSVAAIMGSLDGAAVVSVGQGTINNDAVRSWTQDIALRLIDSLNPFASKDKYTVLQCGVVNLSLQNGVATSDRGIAVQTPKFHVTGSGTVNLGTETLDMAVKTGVREGAGLATANLANLVRLRGPLTDPTLAVDPLGAARTAVSAGAAIASGGLSLLAEQVIERTAEPEDVCAVALGRKPAPAPAQEQQAAPAQPSVPDNPLDAVKGMGENLGEGLKGLFGR
ncbi:AsmA family protein [Caenispirillum salinarum]|uniref:AsmA family protein n=1 Tax=Caenispirillum salinarum TaxID=859058 RepID=UPI0038502076